MSTKPCAGSDWSQPNTCIILVRYLKNRPDSFRLVGCVGLLSEQCVEEGLCPNWVDDTHSSVLLGSLRNRLILLWAGSLYNRIRLPDEIF